jgi:hypothetical protein
LKSALEDALPGDVILIRQNGRIELNTILLAEKGLDVTIKPVEGFHPVLTFVPTDKDSALFRLNDGKLTLQDLDFKLEPAKEGYEVQALVAIAGDGSCSINNCTLRMSDPLGGCQLAAVVLTDPGSVMRRPMRPTEIGPFGPSLVIDGSFIRGKGDLLWCRASRPFKFKASESLFALEGSLIVIDGSKGDSLPAAGSTGDPPHCEVDLQKVTATVSGPGLHLRAAGDIKGLVPLNCKVSDCLLTPLGSKKMILLSGLDSEASDMTLKNRLEWKGSHNAYGPFSALLEQQPGQVGMMRPRLYNQEKWKEITGETDGKFLETIKFADPIDTASLARSRPSQFAVPDLQKDYGANLDNLSFSSRIE